MVLNPEATNLYPRTAYQRLQRAFGEDTTEPRLCVCVYPHICTWNTAWRITTFIFLNVRLTALRRCDFLQREKMIFIIPLFIILTSCVCGTFVVNVTQTSYQAEEGDDITLEWRFTTKPDTSSNSLFIFCQLLTDLKPLVLFHLHDSVEVSEFQDEQFAGRVHCDKDVLREGRVRLNVSRLRTDDSGLYLCKVRTDDGLGSAKCRLNVTADVDEPKPQRPTVRPEPESRRRIGLYVGLTAALLAVCAGLCFAFRLCFHKPVDKKEKVSSASHTVIAKWPSAVSQPGRDVAVGEDNVQVEGDEG